MSKQKKTKEFRSRMLIATITAVLAVSSATYAVSAQSTPQAAATTASSVSRYKVAAGGITDIDAPYGAVAGKVTVTGWALNASGISRVDVYAWDSNGTPHSLGSVAANALTARPDVKTALPDYGTLNSGYSLPVDTTSLKAGTYTLAVAGIGDDGSVQWASHTITIGPTPLTDIDAPSGEQDGSFNVSGWALNHDGINRVDVYAWDSNGTPHSLGSVASAALTARQDVENAFPTFNKLNSGYSLTVADKTLPTGKYTLAVAGIGNDGDVQWATKGITVGPAPLTDIDTPNWTRVTDGKLPVSGWALNKSGINRVDMYALDNSGHYHSLGSVDGDKLAARQDVENAFPAFNTLNSGYSLTTDVSSLSAGSYTLCVAGIGNDGSVQWATKQFSIPGTTTAAPITDLDTPSTTYTGTIPVYGWALNNSGINRVDIYAYSSGSTTAIKLGSVAGDALTARQDVENAFPGYGTLNSGYSFTVPAGTLANGNYTLAVAGVGNDGSVQWITKSIAVQDASNTQGTNIVRTYTDEITGITQTVHFQAVGFAHEVGGGYADINTTPALGTAHYGFGAVTTLIGTNGIKQSEGTAVTKDGSDGGSFTFSNLTAATYTIQLTANDGTVVAKYSFVVDFNGNVE